MNTPASYELHGCTLTYRGVVKSLSYSHEKQVPYHAMKHTISSKNKGSNLHFRCVFLSSRFLLSQRDTWNRLLGSNFVYLQVMIGCGRWKIGNNNNELIYISLESKIKTTHGVQIVFATQCLLWMHLLIITHCSGNQATTSSSRSFKVSVQAKCCHEVAVVVHPEKVLYIVEGVDINTVHLAMKESQFNKNYWTVMNSSISCLLWWIYNLKSTEVPEGWRTVLYSVQLLLQKPKAYVLMKKLTLWEKSIETLCVQSPTTHMLPCARALFRQGQNWLFQQDNSPWHTSRESTFFFFYY